jgi:hypothetical protein
VIALREIAEGFDITKTRVALEDGMAEEVVSVPEE